MDNKPNKVFFPNLDGLRFIAFFAVFFHHAFLPEVADTERKSALFQFINAQKQNGAMGVNLFFVLSGFLITYLLLHEKNIRLKINIPNFYVRRVLRIWPLYFIVVIAGFFILPFIKAKMGEVLHETATLPYYVFFASNFEMMRKGLADSTILNVLWSVGIEEQFYLVWPVVLSVLPRKTLVPVFFSIIIGSIIFRAFYAKDFYTLYFHTFSVCGDLILGGLVAWYSYHNKKFIDAIQKMSRSFIVSVYVIGFTLIIFNYLIFVGPVMQVIERPIFALFFAFIIVEQNFAKHSLYKMSNNKFLSKWGNYTYGLYCLHTIGILAAHILSEKILKIHNLWALMAIDFTVALALAMLMASISYHFFESPFLKLKNKFSYITRG
jgi:peptidoglycan/LPS O-acetylase OafA/YrhL